MNNVEFQEESAYSPALSSRSRQVVAPKGLVAILVKFGIAKSESGAITIMLITSVIALIATGILLATRPEPPMFTAEEVMRSVER